MNPAPLPAPARQVWPDQLKGLGIFLVVLGHVWRGLHSAGLLPEGVVFQALDRLIYAFHMPLFFFLSGLFFESALRRPLLPFLQGRVRALLWPLVLWTWIYFAFKATAGQLTNSPLTWAEFPLVPLPPREQFWFLWALFLIQLGAWGLLRPLVRAVAPRPGLRLLAWGLATGLIFVPLGGLLPAEWVGAALRYATYFGLGFLWPALVSILAPGLAPILAPGLGRAALPAGLGLFLAAEALALASLAGAGKLFDTGIATGAVLGLALAAPGLSGRLPAMLVTLGQASAAIYVSHTIFAAALRILLVKAGVTALAPHLALGVLVGIAGPLILQAGLQRLGLARLAGLERG